MPIRLRLVPGWKRLVLLAAPITLGLAVAVGAYVYHVSATAANPPAAPANNPVLDVPPQPGLLVHVLGAVENPGLYRLPRGDRVFDAIAAAGGFSADFDSSRLPDLAGRLNDGEQCMVPVAKTSSVSVLVLPSHYQLTY